MGWRQFWPYVLIQLELRHKTISQSVRPWFLGGLKSAFGVRRAPVNPPPLDDARFMVKNYSELFRIASLARFDAFWSVIAERQWAGRRADWVMSSTGWIWINAIGRKMRYTGLRFWTAYLAKFWESTQLGTILKFAKSVKSTKSLKLLKSTKVT